MQILTLRCKTELEARQTLTKNALTYLCRHCNDFININQSLPCYDHGFIYFICLDEFPPL